MTSAGSKLLIAGLRGSGKTTYLAALWHLLEAAELPTSLVAAHLQPDREYLNRIRSAWLSFQEVGRTPLTSEETISLFLKDSESQKAIDVILPDLSGESFKGQWEMRRAKADYAEFVKNSSGMILFIHPQTVRKTQPILPSNERTKSSTIRTAASGSVDVASEAEDAKNNIIEWSPEFTSTQVQLVELIQFVNLLRDESRPFRVAIAISAWDLVQDQILPLAWVERRLPLLYQFFLANDDTFPFRVYGISALGGDLLTDLPALKEEIVPANRIKVIDGSLEPHRDLTAPIRFLLALGSEN